MGLDALLNITSGSSNSALGEGALLQVSEEGKNTALGYYAGSNLVSGENNTVIGFNAQPSNSTASNEVTIGNADVTQTRLMGAVTIGNATWSGGGTNGLGIQASSNSASPFAFYIRNSDDTLITSVRCNGDTNFSGLLNSAATYNNTSPGGVPNMYIAPDGTMYRSTATYYSTEEVDGLINAKDKVIEKLSARLDELELKFKALK